MGAKNTKDQSMAVNYALCPSQAVTGSTSIKPTVKSLPRKEIAISVVPLKRHEGCMILSFGVSDDLWSDVGSAQTLLSDYSRTVRLGSGTHKLFVSDLLIIIRELFFEHKISCIRLAIGKHMRLNDKGELEPSYRQYIDVDITILGDVLGEEQIERFIYKLFGYNEYSRKLTYEPRKEVTHVEKN